MADPTRSLPRRSDMAPCVRVATGPLRGHVVAVHDRLEIGRASSSDIQLLSSGVSRTHAVILPRDGKFMLIDMLSTNGTFVGGERIDQYELRFGDRFRIADCELAFELFDEPGIEVPAQNDERARRPTYPILTNELGPTPSRIEAVGRDGEAYGGDLFADIAVYRNLRLRSVRDNTMPGPMRSRLEELEAALRPGAASEDGPPPFERYSLRAPATLEFAEDGPPSREVWLLEVAVDGATCAGNFDDVELEALCWLAVPTAADSARRIVFTCRVFWSRQHELGLVFSGAPGSPEHERTRKPTTQKLRAM